LFGQEVSFRQRCETPVERASGARRLIRGDRHGWRAAPRSRAGNPQWQPWVRFRSERLFTERERFFRRVKICSRV